MQLRRLLPAVWAVLLLSAGGCVIRVPDPVLPIPSSSPSEQPSAAPSTAEPSPTAEITSAAPPPPAAHVPTSAELRRALLTAGDLAGFAVVGDSGSGGASLSGCPALESDFTSGASATAEVLLSQGDQGPFIRERLRQFSQSGAHSVISQIRGAASACASFSSNDPTLGTLNFTVTTLGQPNRGDENAALRVTIKAVTYDITIYENLVAVRRGGTILVITHVSTNGIDNGLTGTATNKAYQRITTW